MPAEVFISYSSKDRPSVMAFAERLQQAGVSVWIDQRGIEGAHLWAQDIAEALLGCKVMALMLTRNSVASHNVVKEVALAGDENKHLLPLRLEPVELPTSMRYHLAGVQYLDPVTSEGADCFPVILQCLADLGVSVPGVVPHGEPPQVTARPRADRPRHNLPTATTPLVGRESEATALRELLLRPETRLVTLLALGGMGKTRLALRMAELGLEDFRDGVWWSEQEHAATGEELVETLAAELGLTPDPDTPPRAQLQEYLRPRELLLVLDNVEQVPDAGAVIAELLQAAESIKCLATSRRVLGLHAEHVVTVTALSESEAQALFVERARSRLSSFALTPANGPSVAELCRRLEGVPLAIELAATRIATLSPQEMLTRLTQRLDFLESQAPDLPARQRTLRGAMDWSYELLTEVERSVFARLSVFAGGFFATGALRVGETDERVIASLVDKSLLRSMEIMGRVRYEMSESIRDYATEKLTAVESARAAHAAYFLDQLNSWAEHVNTAREADVLQLLDLELANLSAAWDWATARGSDPTLARLALAAAELFRRHGLWRERRVWLESGLEAARRHESLEALELARLLYALGFARLDAGAYGEATECLQFATDQFRELGDMGGEADCLNRLGNVSYRLGKLDLAQQQYEEALLLRQALGDRVGESGLLNNLGILSVMQDRLDEARAYFEECLAIDRELENPAGIPLMLNNLAYLALRTQDLDLAAGLLEEARTRALQLGDRWLLAHVMDNLGDLAHRHNDHNSARESYRESLRLRRDLQDTEETLESLLSLGTLFAEDQKWMEAALVLTVAEREFAALESPDLDKARAGLDLVAAGVGAERLAQLQRVGQRLTLPQAVERALTT